MSAPPPTIAGLLVAWQRAKWKNAPQKRAEPAKYDRALASAKRFATWNREEWIEADRRAEAMELGDLDRWRR